MSHDSRKYQSDEEALRLVKLRLPARLVRLMDRMISTSQGAYLDRNEFVADALWDRINEEAVALLEGDRPRADSSVRSAIRTAPKIVPDTGQTPASVWGWGSWRGREFGTAPGQAGAGVNFGLHNRDLPTLWALDRLASAVAEHSKPVKWDDFTRSLREEAQALGSWLRDRDEASSRVIRAAVGFPKPGAKSKVSEGRFIVGSVAEGPGRKEGPFLVLGLAAFVENARIAPTDQGLRVLGELLDIGISDALPQRPEALRAWWAYLGRVASDEQRAWSKVLSVIRTGPTRVELVSRFPEWPRTKAETNCMGFVSRSREWGLVEPQMTNGRYRLTTLGRAVAEEEGAA